MVEALTAHTSNIEKWADERGLAISTPKSAIILFTSQFAQSHPQLTLNNSLYYPLERHYVYWEVTFDPHFKFNDHVKSIVTPASPRIKILRAHAGLLVTTGVSKRKPY